MAIIMIFTVFSLTACGNKTYDEISYKQLNEMLENKESFILFIGSSTCSACAVYRETLNEVINEYNVDVKYIDLHALSDEDNVAVTNLFPISGTPTTVFITNGEEKDTYNRISGNVAKSKIVEKLKENDYIKG